MSQWIRAAPFAREKLNTSMIFDPGKLSTSWHSTLLPHKFVYPMLLPKLLFYMTGSKNSPTIVLFAAEAQRVCGIRRRVRWRGSRTGIPYRGRKDRRRQKIFECAVTLWG